MRNMIFYSIGIIPLLFFLTTTDRQKKIQLPKPAGEARWTGTITMEEKFEGLTGKSERKVTVSFVNALPTLNRDTNTTDLNFTDDKGTGSVIFHGDAILAGKKIGYTDCQGSGKSELHEVVLDESDNTYFIHAIGPACSGTSVSLLDGHSEPYGPEETDIIISQEQLTDKNVLSGSKTEVIDMGGDLGTVTKIFTWRLTRTMEAQAELIVTPNDYDNWLPIPGQNENMPGSILNISFRLQGINGAPLRQKAKQFILQLAGTSKEPGLTINYPLRPLDPALPDLQFRPQPNAVLANLGQDLIIPCTTPCISGTASIAAYDGGGYASLYVYAILQDDTRITGQLLVSGGISDIPIPKRNSSIIAQKWLDENGNPGDYDDKETSKDNNNDGDGLTAYEEYRGVMSEGNYKRLDPQKKELGIFMPRSLIGTFSTGLNWFETSSDIKVVRFYVHEIAANRQLNKNYSTGHIYDQYALYLISGALPSMVGGKAYTTTDNPEIPARTTRVVIDLSQMPAIFQALVANESPLPVPYTQVEILASTISHEIAHGVNVAHHADIPDLPSPITVDNNTSPIHHIYDTRGNEIRTRPFIVSGIIGAVGNQESGDLDCVMAYNPYCSWAFQTGLNGTHIYRRVPPMTIGRNLCKSGDGTGINASPGGNTINRYFGNAPVGNCLLQLKLKD